MESKETPETSPEFIHFKITEHIGIMPMILIAIAVLAVAGWVLAAVFIGTGKTSAETASEDATQELIQDVTDGDYGAILEQVDTSDLPLLGLLISETTERAPEEIHIFEPDADLKKSRVAEEFVRGYFPTLKKSLSEGNIKSLDSNKLSNGQCLVAVYSFDRPDPYPIMMIKSGDDWKLDLSAMLVMTNAGETSSYVIDSARELLKNPTEEDAARALAIMEAAEGLEEKYDLWLEPRAKSLLPVEVASGIARGKALASEFEGLLDEAKATLKKVTGSEESTESTPEPEPIPIPPEIKTIEGEGEQVTAPLELKQGLAIIHFEHPGAGRFTVTLMDGKGSPLGQVADYLGSVSGSQALGVAEGTYMFKVESLGPWKVGTEEPMPAQAPYPPQTFTGEGPIATPFFQTRGGPITVKMEHAVDGDFVVTIVELGGNAVALMAHEDGPFSGSKLVSLKSGIFYLLNVGTRGPWSITIEQNLK
ncbi:MAG: hypothetical protein JJE48_01100 [Actinobacteria bacterium]|nr:hypothetical protein [Actinomycetota bacterium]